MEKKTNPLRPENPAMVSIVGKSGSGKTTLLEKLIPELRGMGLKVGTIKHDVHGFEIDHPGKDSWRHKQAGSRITIISSPQRIGMVMDVDHDHTLDELASFFSGVDIVLTEGYKRENKPKIEIFRREAHTEPVRRYRGPGPVFDRPFQIEWVIGVRKVLLKEMPWPWLQHPKKNA
jgi:molybdopterin-guanine dinucleotide biosynthesis protein B